MTQDAARDGLAWLEAHRGRPRHRGLAHRLVGSMPLVVSGGLMPARIFAMILGCLGLAEPLGRVGRLAIGPGGPLVPGGCALMPVPALAALLVPVVVVRHSTEPSSTG
jgi:hypothetical protein